MVEHWPVTLRAPPDGKGAAAALPAAVARCNLYPKYCRRWAGRNLCAPAGTRVRYALISDIHANLPALEAVLSALDRRNGIDGFYHLGDLVGYAPWPDETVALLEERRIPGVAGNYDSTVATDYKHCGCKYEDPRQEELSHLS